MELAPLTEWVVLTLVALSGVATSLNLQGDYIIFKTSVMESNIQATVTSSNVVTCLALCQRTPGCRGVSRHVTDSKTCRLHDATVLSPDTALQADPDWTYYELSQGAEVTTPWQLAFRATAGIDKSVMAAWDKVGHHDVLTAVPPGCLTTNGHFFCDRHFRSSRLDNWHNVTEVKLAMYDNGTKVVDMVFNGTGSSYTSWFSKTRLLSSPWTDLTQTTPTNFDSMHGHSDLQRRFFMNQLYASCEVDTGWICVADAASCAWEVWGSHPPVFVYSPLTTQTRYSQNGAYADVMAVYVKLSSQP